MWNRSKSCLWEKKRGSSDELTRTEINKLVDFIKEFENETLALQGSMKILLFKGENLSRRQVEETQEKLNFVVTALLKKTKLLSAHYELRDFEALLKELQPFLNKTEAMDSYLLWFSFVESIKELFMGEKARFIRRIDSH